ncbi:uracil-xanthine permease [Pseudomonas lurida]
MQDEFNDPLWRQILSGAQMLFVAFGALVLMPLITGLDPNVALFTAGLGTLLFQVVTGRQVPVFLASSFAFITPIILAKGQFGLAATMGGVMAAGFVYTFLGLAVKIKGTGFIDRLLPPVVIGPVIISIGLAMAPIAANMAMGKAGDGTELIHYQTAMMISMPALLTTLIVAVFGKGIFRLVPIISGVLVGFAMSFYFGVVDTAKIAAAPWFALPHFTAPEFNWQAILFIVPVALAPAIEHIGGVIAVGSVTGRDYLKKPGLHRTLLGDGIATTAAGLSWRPAEHHLRRSDGRSDADQELQPEDHDLGSGVCHQPGVHRQVRRIAAEHSGARDGRDSVPVVRLDCRGGDEHADPPQDRPGRSTQPGDRVGDPGVRDWRCTGRYRHRPG